MQLQLVLGMSPEQQAAALLSMEPDMQRDVFLNMTSVHRGVPLAVMTYPQQQTLMGWLSGADAAQVRCGICQCICQCMIHAKLTMHFP